MCANAKWCETTLAAIDEDRGGQAAAVDFGRHRLPDDCELTATGLGLQPGVLVSAGGGDNMMGRSARGKRDPVDGKLRHERDDFTPQ